jgi:Mor family transcriptional regulator
MKPDQETAKVLAKGSKLRDFVKSESWVDVKSQLTEKLVELADITTLSDVDPTQILQEIKTRKLAINLVMGWVREIEGQANQHEANEQAFRTIKEESVTIHF